VQYAGYPNVNDACARGEQFGVQVVGAIVIIAWALASSTALFLGMKYTMGLRVSELIETQGLDVSEHGAVVDEPTQADKDQLAKRASFHNGDAVTPVTVVTVGGSSNGSSVPFNAVAPGDPNLRAPAGASKPPPKQGWGEDTKKLEGDSLDMENLLS
jgi:hypothetical protein